MTPLLLRGQAPERERVQVQAHMKQQWDLHQQLVSGEGHSAASLADVDPSVL